MTEQFEVHIEAERFVHNTLATGAWHLRKAMHERIDANEREGLFYITMSALILSAFSIEAKVNFVGWKLLNDKWNERASLEQKIDELFKLLDIEVDWETRPLRTVKRLKRYRNFMAHGKPETVNEVLVVSKEPDVWDAVTSEWEAITNEGFVDECYADVAEVWRVLRESAGIPEHETLTHGGHTISKIG